MSLSIESTQRISMLKSENHARCFSKKMVHKMMIIIIILITLMMKIQYLRERSCLHLLIFEILMQWLPCMWPQSFTIKTNPLIISVIPAFEVN